MVADNNSKQKGKKVFSQRGTSFLTLSSSYTTQLDFKETQSLDDPSPPEEEPPPPSEPDYSTLDEPEVPQEPQTYEQEMKNDPSYSEESSQKETKKSSIISTRIYSLKRESAKDADDAREELKRMLIGEDKPSAKNKSTRPIAKKVSKKTASMTKEISVEVKEDKIVQIADKVTTAIDQFQNIKEKVIHPLIGIKDAIASFFKERFEFLTILWAKIGSVVKPQIDRLIYPFVFIKDYVQNRKNNLRQAEEETEEEEEEEPVKPVSFTEMAEKGIIFTDNKKRPLYTLDQLKGKAGYSASESVFTPLIMENIIIAFKEVAPKAKSIPIPQAGKYAGMPMTDIMNNITEEEVMVFLNYVMKYPRGYIAKNFRITESFAGWVVSGTPDD